MINDVNFANLKADIGKNGILEPILIFEGRILDGRNRYRAGKAVGRLSSAKFKAFEGSYADAEAYVFSTNFLRRQMTNAQKQEVIRKMIEKYPKDSNRQIARRCGISSHASVGAVREKMLAPSPDQKKFTEFCKIWDALSEIRREGEQEPISALEYLQSIYRNPMEETGKRIRAATEALPHESPRMSAVSVGYYDGNTFAERLDRAIDASNRAKVIEGRVIERDD